MVRLEPGYFPFVFMNFDAAWDLGLVDALWRLDCLLRAVFLSPRCGEGLAPREFDWLGTESFVECGGRRCVVDGDSACAWSRGDSGGGRACEQRAAGNE